MDVDRDETSDVARDGVPSSDQGPPGSSSPAAPQRTTHLLAFDHLAAGLTWAQITQCTLSAAQHVNTASLTAGDGLKHRMVLNYDSPKPTFTIRRGCCRS